MLTKELITVSPTASSVTPSPTSTTVPAPSWPRISGNGMPMVPLTADKSLWHTPQAPSLTITSPRCGDSTSISSTTTGALFWRQMTAFALRPMLTPRFGLRWQALCNLAREIAKPFDAPLHWIAQRQGGNTRITMQATVPVKSLGPCSKEVSDDGAHNQRSHIGLQDQLREPGQNAIDWCELVRFAEDNAS